MPLDHSIPFRSAVELHSDPRSALRSRPRLSTTETMDDGRRCNPGDMMASCPADPFSVLRVVLELIPTHTRAGTGLS
jgi:hypothetical protein